VEDRDTYGRLFANYELWEVDENARKFTLAKPLERLQRH
jgi:hypothetical protein